MENLRRLQELPINKGLYVVLPNSEAPLFIIPLTSRWAYKKGISLIKSRNIFGAVKKRLLAEIPFFILKRFFTTISVDTIRNDKHSGQLILPWNQDTGNKFTIFNYEKNDITLLKIGFEKGQNLVDNEFKFISLISKISTNAIPEIKSYSKLFNHSILETIFYRGKHPDSIPDNVKIFFQDLHRDPEKVRFNEHPYISRINNVLCRYFAGIENKAILHLIVTFNARYSEHLVPVVIMHGDCSMTNVIESDGSGRLIDWEEGVMDGAPLDLTYFCFRKTIDNGDVWKIRDLVDYLVVLHYLYFQIKHGNMAFFDRLEWNEDTLRVQ